MRIKITLFLVAFLAYQSTVYGQFNTIKRIKVLPEIQPDTTQDKREEKAHSPVLKPGSLSDAKAKANATVSMPLSSPVVNSIYGSRIDPLSGEVKFHQGIDFKGSSDLVMVIMPGEVVKVGYSRGLGNYIEVEHGDFKTTYGHLSMILTREKTKVSAGSVIGITGSTGRSTGDHLHFTIKYKGKAINPTPFLDLIYRTIEVNARKGITRAD